jgi:type I restriction enzyme, R subunit
MTTPEALARLNIDAQLAACGWVVQDRRSMNLFAGRGVAAREWQARRPDWALITINSPGGRIHASTRTAYPAVSPSW